MKILGGNMIDEFQKTAREIFIDARKQERLLYNESIDVLKVYALQEPEVRETIYRSIMVESEPTSRAAAFTENNVDSGFGEGELRLLEQAKRWLAKEELVSIDVFVGDGSDDTTARLIVPLKYAHVAYGGLKLFKQTSTRDPTYQVIMFFDEKFDENKSKKLPDKDITIRNAHSPYGDYVRIARNTNYLGEWKKGIFTAQDYRAKLRGDAIFLHAGCRNDYLEMAHEGFKSRNSLFIALSANGKTSLTCRVLARKEREESWLVQDDGGTLGKDGSFRGFEAGGVYVKTDSIGPEGQTEIYFGALKPGTFLENVHVEPDGRFNFSNRDRTTNGRAVIERRDIMHASQDINTERIDNIFLITRGGTIPAVAKITPEEATIRMIEGIGAETTAGDPTQAGKIKSEFFYDPFIAGDRTAHANLFYDILKTIEENNGEINCYLLNTGGVGEREGYRDITLKNTKDTLDSVIRGGLEDRDWQESPTGLMVPKAVRLVDSILIHPEQRYPSEELEERLHKLHRQRMQTLEKYPGLDRRIMAALEK